MFAPIANVAVTLEGELVGQSQRIAVRATDESYSSELGNDWEIVRVGRVNLAAEYARPTRESEARFVESRRSSTCIRNILGNFSRARVSGGEGRPPSRWMCVREATRARPLTVCPYNGAPGPARDSNQSGTSLQPRAILQYP